MNGTTINRSTQVESQRWRLTLRRCQLQDVPRDYFVSPANLLNLSQDYLQFIPKRKALEPCSPFVASRHNNRTAVVFYNMDSTLAYEFMAEVPE